MNVKTCTICKMHKPLDLYNSGKGKYKKDYRCKSCQSLYVKNRVLAMKNMIYERYGGYICACCGETERAFLSIDHVNNDANRNGRKGSHSSTDLYRWIINNNFPEGFQVLCHNCNLGRYINGGLCPHSTGKAN